MSCSSWTIGRSLGAPIEMNLFHCSPSEARCVGSSELECTTPRTLEPEGIPIPRCAAASRTKYIGFSRERSESRNLTRPDAMAEPQLFAHHA